MILTWATLTIDFSNAFEQSSLPESKPMSIKVPKGYKCTNGPEHYLKLKKSLHGHKVAPLLWHKHVTKLFKKLGLKQSAIEPCLWYNNNMTPVQYVDNCGVGAPDMKTIDKFIAGLKAEGPHSSPVKGSFSEFPGIKFDNHRDGSMEMTQKGCREAQRTQMQHAKGA